MPLDPRTPVVVGVGQVTVPPDPATDPGTRPEPLELMVRALRAAAEDCGGSGAGARLLAGAGSLAVVDPFSWQVPDPGRLVADRIGISPPDVVRSGVGGNSPLSLLHRAATLVARGALDVALVAGGDALHTRRAARRSGRTLHWAAQDAATPAAPRPFGPDHPPATELEMARGIRLPVHAYPLLENALRAAEGWTLEEHRARIGALWSAFSEVAASNPYAWIQRPVPAEAIVTVRPDNRMVATPYPKLCTANISVDQGAAFICCSAAAAHDAGVPADRWVFPLAGADAHDHWTLSERSELHRSPAIRLAGSRAFALAEVGPDELGTVDLYSCFPVVVRMAAAELGLDPDDPARPLTSTGGLTFAGGPGNNSTTHGIAAVAGHLRAAPGSAGLVTGLGWYATKHAVGVLASRPPAHEGRDGFRWEDVQGAVDVLPRCPVDEKASGRVTIESATVTYGRDGAPDLGILVCRTPEGARTWANVVDPGALEELAATEAIGRRGDLGADGLLALA